MARGLLSGLMEGGLDRLISKTQLKELGWATGGGAAGFVAASYALPMLDGVPFVGGLNKSIKQGALGLVGARLAWGWNQDFAKGMAGGLVGHAVASFALSMLGKDMSALADVGDQQLLPGTPGDEEYPSLPEGDGEMADIEPSQSFNGLGVSIEESRTLAGSFLS